MGADWYTCVSYYGYEIKIPLNKSYRQVIKMLKEFCIPMPFMFNGILSEFHSRMEGSSLCQRISLDNNAQLFLGFKVPNDLNTLLQLQNDLDEFIKQNPILNDIEFKEESTFFSGIEWYDDVEDEDEY